MDSSTHSSCSITWCTYGFTWGPNVPWLIPAEIFNFIIGMVSPDASAGIGGYFYLIFAGFCFFSAILAYFYYVETAGHTLEEIPLAFGDQAFVDNDEEVKTAAGLQPK